MGRGARAGALLLAAALILVGRGARGDGAFPDSMRLFLPDDRPQELVLATNFGLVVSDDGGARWSWSCESAPALDAAGYQMGPGPGHRIFGVAGADAVYTDDLGCHWAKATLPRGDLRVLDVFPDPVDARRVFAAAVGSTVPKGTGDGLLLVSRDGGTTFAEELYGPGANTLILGVESARSNPDLLYVTLRQGPGTHPRLARSDDGGRTWRTFDAEPAVGAFDLGLAAVDPTDPMKVYLRVYGFPDELLAISDDGGATLRVATRIERGTLTAFTRRADGTLLVAGLRRTGGVVLRSTDGGWSWSPWPAAPHARDLPERGDTLYLVGDDGVDEFAIATADADGSNLRRRMRLGDVTAVRSCAVPICATACAAEAARRTFAAGVCEAPPSDVTTGARSDGAPPPAAADAGLPPTSRGGASASSS